MIAEQEMYTGWVEQVKISPVIQTAFLRLSLAILAQAVRDAGKQTPEGDKARAWLLSEDAELYLFLAGIERIEVERWLHSGAHIRQNQTKPDQTIPKATKIDRSGT